MGSFGNYVGATMGGEYDDSWVTNSNYPERQALLQNGKLVKLSDPTPATDSGRYTPKSSLLGEVPGLTSDHSTYEQVEQDLHGPGSLNWESWTFAAMRAEMEALQPAQVDALATAWKSHGDNLHNESKSFNTSVSKVISDKWSGASADAAAKATKQVTNTSIYDFTPSSDALSNRLTALSQAFTSIKNRFPTDANAQLIDSGNFNQQQLDQAVTAFNSEYHLDGSGHLRNNSDGYVAAAQAVEQMNQLKRSISDYQLAVQLFRDTYNPTVEAVTSNFPNLPAAPDMTYGQQGGKGTGTGTGTRTGSGSGFGGGGGGLGLGGGTAALGLGSGPSTSAIPNAQLTSPTITSPGQAVSQVPADASAAASPLSTSGLQGLSSLGQGLSSPLQSALQNAARAGQAANTGALPNSVGNLPKEGALNLAPKGLKSGAGGSGTGGGAGARSPAIGKPAGAPATAAGTAPGRTVAAASRAGISGGAGAAGAGAPGAGAPGSGHQGAAAAGTQHQPSKVLRRKKNGEEIIGDSEAVVAVLGEPAQADAAKPNPARENGLPSRGGRVPSPRTAPAGRIPPEQRA